MGCLLLSGLVSFLSLSQKDLGSGWRAHLRMDCRPYCALPVPFSLICYPRLLSRTDNIELNGVALMDDATQRNGGFVKAAADTSLGFGMDE